MIVHDVTEHVVCYPICCSQIPQLLLMDNMVFHIVSRVTSEHAVHSRIFKYIINGSVVLYRRYPHTSAPWNKILYLLELGTITASSS